MINLSEWSLKNKVVVWYFVAVTVVFGIFSFFKMGRMEDPAYAVRTMVVTAAWPGASAEEMEEQVTDKLERKFSELPNLDYTRSVTRPGSCIIYLQLKESPPKDIIRPSWRDVRGLGEDIKIDLPEGVRGPFYNDRFDDVYGSLYAVTGDGYSLEELRAEAEKIRRLILRLDNVCKVELVGAQTEKIYIEADREKLSALGISPREVAAQLKKQNAIAPAAMLDTESDNIYVRVTGKFQDLEAIKKAPISVGGRVFRVEDVAKVERRATEPSSDLMYFNGQPAVGVAVSMEAGGNVLQLGEELTELVDQVQQSSPVGLSVERVADQPAVVAASIDDFVSSLREAVVIVLIVSLLSLGLRTGMVVGICIPLVLLGTFCVMYALGIDLHKVSLGSLVVALGLLVDDEIIAVEMMSLKLEQGLSKAQAAASMFREAAVPMFFGTLITCSGFIPVAFSKGNAAEFCEDLFPVITTTLLLSLIIAVTVAPLLASRIIKTDEGKAVSEAKEETTLDNPMYSTKFYVLFRGILEKFLRHRTLVLAGAFGLFVLSIVGLKLVKQEFFPPSLRPELLVSLRLPAGSSKKAVAAEMARLTEFLQKPEQQERLENFSGYVGESIPRFVLTVDPVLPDDSFGQMVLVAKDVESRKTLQDDLERVLNEEFPHVRASLKTIQTGPPSDYPIMLRVSGYDRDEVRRIAGQVADVVAADPNNFEVNLDWNEKTKVIRLELDQDKLRQTGIGSGEIAETIYSEITGVTCAQYYRGDRTIDIQVRLSENDRRDVSALEQLPISLGQAGYVPLGQLAKITFEMEDGNIWRRNSLPTITVQANIRSGTANDAEKKALAACKPIMDGLPVGYIIEPGGSLENSIKSMGFLMEPIPVMAVVILSLLVFLQKNFRTVVMTILTIPLGFIGITAGMLIFNKAMGFVSILGILSLSGMIARNSIILIDQIQRHESEGLSRYDAIISSAMIRFRPIMLTAGTSILGMIPLMTSAFWGPMAVSIAAGLFVATALTLLVLPTMYAAFYRVEVE